MRAFWGLWLGCLVAGSAAASGGRALNVSDSGDATRIVVETPIPTAFSVFTLAHPDRVVLDLKGPAARPNFPLAAAPHGLVRGVRQGPRPDGLRIVFDVSAPVSAKGFAMAPAQGFGSRVIVDLARVGAMHPVSSDASAAAPPVSTPAALPSPPIAPAAPPPSEPLPSRPLTQSTRAEPAAADPRAWAAPSGDDADAAMPPGTPVDAPAPAGVVPVEDTASSASLPVLPRSATPGTPSASPSLAAVSPVPSAGKVIPAVVSVPAKVVGDSAPVPGNREDRPVRTGGKPLIVAIDAGHGGYDPGARGFAGVNEKDVCLAMARKLAAMVNAEPGMRAVLTRDGDYYVGLRERMEKARAAQADVFVSIHANSYKERSMHGAAVYVISPHGATSEQARWVANRENDADLVGGVDLQSRDQQVAAVLLDISQSATMEASFDLAGRMMDSLHSITDLQKPVVQQAGFMVLKAPDIPSILIETAFITNAREEQQLDSDDFQTRMARAMVRGLHGYFENYRPRQAPPVETAERVPVVQPVSLKRGHPDD